MRERLLAAPVGTWMMRLALLALAACTCSSFVPGIDEALSEARQQAIEDFSCERGDVGTSLVATSSPRQATVAARGCDRSESYDCVVSCGEWSCKRMAR